MSAFAVFTLSGKSANAVCVKPEHVIAITPARVMSWEKITVEGCILHMTNGDMYEVVGDTTQIIPRLQAAEQ